MPIEAKTSAILTEGQIGLIIFFVSLSYCVLIMVFDSVKNAKFVMSKNLLRHLIDGLTLATGVTVALALADTKIFTIVAANSVYVTVTSLTCIFGPILNFAERYERVIAT